MLKNIERRTENVDVELFKFSNQKIKKTGKVVIELKVKCDVEVISFYRIE